MKTPKKEPINVQLNLTPLIDLIMNLLIFFMLVSQMSVVEKTPVDLPRVSQGKAPVIKPEDKVPVTMKRVPGTEIPSYQVGSIPHPTWLTCPAGSCRSRPPAPTSRWCCGLKRRFPTATFARSCRRRVETASKWWRSRST